MPDNIDGGSKQEKSGTETYLEVPEFWRLTGPAGETYIYSREKNRIEEIISDRRPPRTNISINGHKDMVKTSAILPL